MRLSVLALLLLAPLTAVAEDFGTLTTFLEPRDGALACWDRTYSADHLAKHPDQKVEAMKFTLEYDEIEPNEDWVDGHKAYYFELQAKLRGKPGRARAVGDCFFTPDKVIFCGIECDGGGVAVSRAKNGEDLFIDLERSGYIRMTYSCGVDDGQEETINLEPEPDDRNFLLQPLPVSQCAPFWDPAKLDEGID